MCGINLIVDKRSQLSEWPIQQMNKAIAYRGPDATGFNHYQGHSERIFIGHNRLKIIDKSEGSNQPIISSDGRYILSFNGEIYNYRELKVLLQKEIIFKTSSDTEVLLQCLIKYGTQALSRLNGMFALVFYDKLEDTIIIARDPSGIKPIYYYEDENYLICSSEIKGVLAAELVKKEFNSGQVDHYFKFKYVRKPETFYKNIFELEEGCFLEYKNASSRIYKYSTPIAPTEVHYSKEEIVRRTEELLIESVQRHLVTDVPIGVFLSGGVDSTLLLAIVSELGIKNFPSFSISNSKHDKSFGTSDFHFARLAAKQYGAEHHEYEIDSSILKYFPEFISSIDQPIADNAAMLTWLLSKNASGSVKAVLSGAGADEVFGGYNRYKAYGFYLKYFKGNEIRIRSLKSIANILPDGFPHPLRKYFRLINKFASQLEKESQKTFSNFSAQEGFENLIIENTIVKEDLSDADLLGQALKNDRYQYLISDVLSLTDKMSMQNSLEVRLPFLDKSLLEFTDTIAPEYLLKHGRKWILKELLNKRKGVIYTKRTKEGFGMPIGAWLKKPEGKFLLNYLKKESCVFEFVAYEKVSEMLNLHMKSKRDFSSGLWSVIQLSAWLEKEF